MARGYLAAQRIHEQNTGMGYTPFKVKAGEVKQVRILQSETDWLTLFIHQKYPTLKQCRCAAAVSIENDQEVEDRSVCPLCMVEAPRTSRVFIPVRVRRDEDTSRVQIISYGRDHFAQLINQIENLPNGKTMTDFDFKVSRKGDKLDTVYFWNLVADPEFQRPLNDSELALKIPNIEEVMPILEESILIRRAQVFSEAGDVQPVASSSNGNGKTPF